MRARLAAGAPSGAMMLYWRLSKSKRDLRPTSRSDLLVDGFPRSANTYLTLVALLRGPTRRIAHHLHSRSSFDAARRHAVPAIVVVRNPMHCLSSLHVRDPWRNWAHSVYYYEVFHARVLGAVQEGGGAIEVVRFEDVIDDAIEVLRRTAAAEMLSLDMPLSEAEHRTIRESIQQLDADPRRTSLPVAGGRQSRFVPPVNADQSLLRCRELWHELAARAV